MWVVAFNARGRAHACTRLVRRGVEWSTDEALWRLRALESAVWVGSLLTVKRAHACTRSWRRWRLARLARLLLPAVH